jgi:NAD(P)-dependent dehydrogenase (short-subunit alcohol dehydrogenase family)
MNIANTIVVVTGGGNGIGRALCRRFAAEGAKAIVVADLDLPAARRVASEIGGTAIEVDVSREADMTRLAAATIAEHGAIDLFCSNAGIAVDGDEQTPDVDWERCWGVNVMAHVYAARAVVPAMLPFTTIVKNSFNLAVCRVASHYRLFDAGSVGANRV